MAAVVVVLYRPEDECTWGHRFTHRMRARASSGPSKSESRGREQSPRNAHPQWLQVGRYRLGGSCSGTDLGWMKGP